MYCIQEEKFLHKMAKKKTYKPTEDFYQTILKNVSDEYTKTFYDSMKKEHDKKPKKRKPDYSKYYDLTEGAYSMTESAHPNRVQMFPNMGNGGLIENTIEQHVSTVERLTNMPHANFQFRLASVMDSLVKLANKADSDGLTEASDLIDSALKELYTLE